MSVTVEKRQRAGGTSYAVRWRERGQSRQRTFPKAGLANEFRDKKVTELARVGGGLPSGDGRMTVGDFYAEKFVPLRGVQVKAGTVAGWEKRWAPRRGAPKVWHLERYWSRWALETVTYEAILEWHAAMKKAGASPATMWRAHDLLVTILGFARKLRFVPSNEAEGLRPEYRPRRADGPWLPATVERIRDVLLERAETPPAMGKRGGGVAHWSEARLADYQLKRRRDAMLISLLAYAGLRPGEALAAKWSWLGERTLRVTDTIPGIGDEADDGGSTKNGEDRAVLLPAFLLSELRAWRMRSPASQEEDPIVPWDLNGAHWDYTQWGNWRKHWARTLAAAGVEYRRPYHLRHSCISMWIAAGRDIVTVAARAGHTVEVCQRTYAHAFEDRDADTPLDIELAVSEARASSAGTPRVALASARSVRAQA